MDTLYVVRYSQSHKAGYLHKYPTTWKIVKITGDAVWGIAIDDSTLARVNSHGGVGDGSGRGWSLAAFESLEEARQFAGDMKFEMLQDEDAQRRKGYIVA